MTIKKIDETILEHYHKYPLMEIEDFIKLIYQNEFGCNHFKSTLEQSLIYIKDELDKAKKNNDDLICDIGNNYLRVNLLFYRDSPEELDLLNKAFYETSLLKSGNMTSFLNKLDILKALIKEKQIKLDLIKSFTYIDKYIEQGCLPISHSAKYHIEYHPSYRVINKEIFEEKIKNGEKK